MHAPHLCAPFSSHNLYTFDQSLWTVTAGISQGTFRVAAAVLCGFPAPARPEDRSEGLLDSVSRPHVVYRAQLYYDDMLSCRGRALALQAMVDLPVREWHRLPERWRLGNAADNGDHVLYQGCRTETSARARGDDAEQPG